MIRQSVAAGIKANIRSGYDPVSVDNHNAEEWIEDPGLTEGEGINLLDVAQLDTSVPTADRLCNMSDDNFGNNHENINGSDKGIYSADSLNCIQKQIKTTTREATVHILPAVSCGYIIM